jgi:hypothetical protein
MQLVVGLSFIFLVWVPGTQTSVIADARMGYLLCDWQYKDTCKICM